VKNRHGLSGKVTVDLDLNEKEANDMAMGMHELSRTLKKDLRTKWEIGELEGCKDNVFLIMN
jgi:hypothetical protein